MGVLRSDASLRQACARAACMLWLFLGLCAARSCVGRNTKLRLHDELESSSAT